MTTPLTDQLRAYFDDVDRQQGAIDIDALRRSVEEREITIELSPNEAVPRHGPTIGRRWPIPTAAASVMVLVVGVFVFDSDDSNAPAGPLSTVSSTATVDTSLSELLMGPLASPIDCGVEQCPWSPELTAQTLDPAIACPGNPDFCLTLAVSPDGTLVALDATTDTLTWYEDEPRVVPLTDELGNTIDAAELIAIGPHDIAYLAGPGRPSYFVAVAPSGTEIRRVDTSATGAPVLYPTATGLTASSIDHPDEAAWLPPNSALWMPWVDLAGNPITDSRPYPTATLRNNGLKVSLGQREWLLTEEEFADDSGLLTFPRSDGGVVMVLLKYGQGRHRVLYLSTDGTIKNYFVDVWPSSVLPDGSLIVQHDRQIVRLTPPAA